MNLREIDNRIIAIKGKLATVMVDAKKQTGPVVMSILEKVATQMREPLEHELSELEAKRRAVLDQNKEMREGPIFRLFWSIVVPVLASLLTTYLALKLGLIP